MESNRASFLSSVIFSIFFCFCTVLALGIDTISARGTLRNRETLVSAGGVFELGFFIDPFSGSTYLGIWFKNDKKKKAVWVANRESPLSGYSSSYLQIRDDGNLILMDQRQTPIIVNSAALATSGNTSAILLDSGNFVLRESGKNLVWQSFDYPSDTFLPGMKVGWFVSPTDQSRIQVLVSWASPLSPTRGEFVLGVDYKGATKMGIWRRDRSHMDIGYWDGKSFQFIFQNSSNSFRFTYISNENETYFTFTTTGNYNLSWLVMASTGHIDEYFMSEGNISTVRHSPCNDSAAVNASVCLIPETSGCPEGDLFLATNGSIPALVAVNGSNSMSSSDCEFMCRSNCSCAAFASGIEGDQTWCQLYYGNKNNILGLLEKGGGAVYIRGDYGLKPNRKKRKRLVLILFNVFVPLIVVILALIWCYPKCRNRYATGNQVQCHNETSSVAEAVLLRGNNNAISSNGSTGNRIELGGERDQDLPLFSFSSIEAATDYFANSNKLGEGGFGLVYKGKLTQGIEIAVKRLSKRSGQGLVEFKNEVSLISKLQHRNLVRLLGCCIEGEENILVYEYLSNKSLDTFIFDLAKRVLLDWRKRVRIIEGIAQGLLYLHKYSRLRIIHRDLKTSNILLDDDLTPKISDFGMARIFCNNESRVKTNRIAGTHGYMSPEYAMDGFFSEKSDVFSFGIIVLEMLSGKRNLGFFEFDQTQNLLAYAWNLFKEGNCMEFIDPTLANSCSTSEAFRHVQIGLLCVQDRPAERPAMSDVVSMLNSDTMALPYPRKPAILIYASSTDVDSSGNKVVWSRNDVTMSEISAR